MFLCFFPSSLVLSSFFNPNNGIDDSGNATSMLKAAYNCPDGSMSNLAIGKSAQQSSSHFLKPASNAVDGNTNGSVFLGSVSCTTVESQPFWEVDLDTIYHVSEITIWNRSDCCSESLSNYYLYVSDRPFISTNPDSTTSQTGVWSSFVSDHPVYADTFSLNRSGRYIRVQLSGTAELSLAEVQVFGCDLPLEICNNGIDDNGNNLTDCEDDLCGVIIDSVSHISFDYCIQGNEMIVIHALGSNLEYSIDNGVTFQDKDTFDQLAIGSYEVMARNSASGCGDSSSINLQCSSFLVMNTNDSGEGSLREAIELSSDGDVIVFDTTLSGSTIFVDSTLVINTGISIIGDSDEPITLSGYHLRVHNLIDVYSSSLIELKNLILRDAVTGIHNCSALQLENVRITSCAEGILNTGDLSIDKSELVSNIGYRRAGGILNATGNAQISNTIISGNSGVQAGGILNQGSLSLTNVLISGNLAQGGGMICTTRCEAGGIYSTDLLIMTNCTVASNSGLIGSVGIQITGYTEITNCIIAGNTKSGEEPSHEIMMADSSAILVSVSSLVADASGSNLVPDGILIGDTSNPIDPLYIQSITEIPSSGGDYSLGCNSVAIDNGLLAPIQDQNFDVRGSSRINGVAVDIGAFENFCCTGEPVLDTIMLDHDLDEDGIPDRLDTDDDNDGVADADDLDDDNDGISDCVERGNNNVSFVDLFDLAGDAEQISPNEIRLTQELKGQAGSAFHWKE